MASPRPYVAAAAAAALAALYFVPSASASPSQSPAQARRSDLAGPAPATTSGGLADTGAMDTKPYMIGGAAFLMAGAGLVVNAGRRSRHTLGERELDTPDDLDV